MNSIEEKAYRCSSCHKVYMDKEFADKCCMPKYCKDCGAEIPTYRTKCDTCLDKSRFANAQKLTEWDGWIYKEGYGHNDGYFDSVDDLIEWVEEQDEEDEWHIPEWVFVCDEKQHRLDVDWLVENELQDAYEDAEFNHMDDLYAFMKQWNEKQNVVSYSPNYGKVLLITKSV